MLSRPRDAPATDVAVHDCVADVPEVDWHAVVGTDRPLQRLPYLRALDGCARRAGVALFYVLVRRGGAPVAAVAVQEIAITPRDVGSGAQRRSRARLGVPILVAGNLVVTGAPAIATARGAGGADAARWLVDAVDAVCAARRRRFGAIILKDVPSAVAAHAPTLAGAGFRALPIEPSMALAVRPMWRNLDDYAGDLRSKYRARLARSRKRSEALERRLLSADDAAALAAPIDRLYRSVYERADFAGPYLGGDYFVALRRELCDGAMDLVGYFAGEELVAVNSRVRAGDAVESYFFGLDHRRNDELALFQSLLVDDLAHAIDIGATRLHLGRTTHEPKAALGAQPTEYPCFYRPMSRWSAPVCWLLASLYRPPRWRARHPFRAEAA